MPWLPADDDGLNRWENITNWALGYFRKQYGDKKISKWDIFHYVYGVLHHPEYREKYAENLKRELPRIPMAKHFRGFAEAGRALARLHVEYEAVEPWPLKFIETGGIARTGPLAHPSASLGTGARGSDSKAGPLAYGRGSDKNRPTAQKGVPWLPFTYRVIDKMRLAKDRKSVRVNESLTLGGIPAEAFEYRLGNRSALEWVIDQYRVREDKRSGIRQDPNRDEDEEYIVRLVVRVSVETVRIVKGLPGLEE